MKCEGLSWEWRSSSYCPGESISLLSSFMSKSKHLVLAMTTGKPLLGQFYEEMAQNLSLLLFCLPFPPFCHTISPIFLDRGGSGVCEGPTQVSTHWRCCCQTGGGVLARAASHGWDRQTTKQQIHGREKRFQKTDGTEGRASVRSEVHFVGVGTGRLSRGIAMAWRTRETA